MEKNKKTIDDLFKKELGNYTEAPPPAVWDALEKRLDGTPSSKPRTPFTWLGYFAAVSGLILISVFVARSISGNSNPGNIAVNTPTTDNSNELNNNVKNSAPGNKHANNMQQTAPNGNNDHGKTAITVPGNKTQNKIAYNKNGTGQNSLPGFADKATDEQKKVSAPNNKTQNKLAGNNKKNHHHNLSDTYSGKTTNSKEGNEIASVEKPQPENIYNSGPSNSEPSSGNIKDNSEAIEPNVSLKDSQTDDSTGKTNSTRHDPPQLPPHHPKFPRFEAGIKGGYESGFDNDASKKLLVSPYLQFNISRKFAIMLQPAIKAADLSGRSIGVPNSYYKPNPDGATKVQTDSLPVHVIDGGTFWLWNYSYTQTHDSIVKSYVTGGTYAEFELPVLLKFYITKEFSVYGGVNMAYSKLTGVTEHTYISGPITKTVTEVGFGTVNAPAPPPPEPLGITYTGTPYSGYTGPLYSAPLGSLLRFGYMIGFSYEFHKNWLFDALIQQSPVAPNIQAGYNVNNPVSAPYFRLTIGYKLLK